MDVMRMVACDTCGRAHTYAYDDGERLVRCEAMDWRKGFCPERECKEKVAQGREAGRARHE